jgi:hypothetical protein
MLAPYDDREMQAHRVFKPSSTKRADTNTPEVMKKFRYERLDL